MPAPVFVLGAPRSGTTLLRVMLAGHPMLFSPPEMVIAPFPTMADRKAKLTERYWEKGGLRRALMDLTGVGVEEAKALEASFDDKTVPEVFAWIQERLGGRILVDKCPHLMADPVALQRVGRWFPDAKYVWIVRHPGSVTRSIENMPMAEVMLQGYASDAREIWYNANKSTQRFLESVPADRQVTIRYEDLVKDARPSMEAVCKMLGLALDERMLDPYEGDRMREGPPGARAVGDPNMAGRGKIEPELATKWLEGFDPASVSPDTHALARELGYDLGSLAAPPITRVTASMNALLDGVRDLEAKIRTPSDLDAVEGRRFLLRMLSASIDLFTEHGDADFPAFHHAEGPTRKMFADNPDADYLRAPIRVGDGRVYRVSGRLPVGTTYVGMLLYGKGGRIARRMTDADFVGADGRFEVRISTEKQDGVWLQADGDETAVFVRQYFHDRKRESPIEIAIALEKPAPVARPLDADAMAKGLEKAKRNLAAVYERTVQAHQMAVSTALNRFMPIGGEQLFPTPDNKYLVCWYRIGGDQVIVVRGQAPKARYWSLCLYNAWMESLDYERHTIALNGTQIVQHDGSFEVVLAHRDPGRKNWLDTTGHHAGYLLLRALLPEGDLPIPSITVMYERELIG